MNAHTIHGYSAQRRTAREQRIRIALRDIAWIVGFAVAIWLIQWWSI